MTLPTPLVRRSALALAGRVWAPLATFSPFAPVPLNLPTMSPARFNPLSVDTVDPGAAARARRDEQLAGWLQQAARGDAQAFEQFYDHTIGLAECLARRFLRDAELDDVLAEAYFQAWREAARYDPARGSAVSWLLTLVRCRAIDLLRQRLRQPTATEADAATLDTLAAALPGPDELLALAEAGGRLRQALAALSTPERWVLGLAYFRELPHSAIAEATGLPLGSVKSLLLRAQQKLRDRMSSD